MSQKASILKILAVSLSLAGCGLAATGLPVPYEENGSVEPSTVSWYTMGAVVHVGPAEADRLAGALPGSTPSASGAKEDSKLPGDQLAIAPPDIAQRPGLDGIQSADPEVGTSDPGGSDQGEDGSTDLHPGPTVEPQLGPAGEWSYPKVGEFVTHSQAQWGSTVSSAPGTYRDAHFAAAFPDGLTVGCELGDSLTLTGPAAVAALLPQGGVPGVLLTDQIDPPTATAAGSLAGEIVALELSVGFDLHDPTLGSSETSLEDLVLAETGCKGLSVKQVLELANAVLGSCRTDWAPSVLVDCLETTNAAFDGGTTATKALRYH